MIIVRPNFYFSHNLTSTTMARPSITGDSALVEDQIQREAETHGNFNPSSEKNKHKISRHGKKSEKRHHGMSMDNMNAKDVNLDHDDSIGIVVKKGALGSSPSKKRKGCKHRDQGKLYGVPGVENLSAKRKTSYRIAQDLAADAIQSETNGGADKAGHPNNISSYPGASPFMSPPKALVPHTSAAKTSLKSPSAQQARLETILKSCSRKTVAKAALEDVALNNESDGSPSPPAGLPRVIVKAEHEAPTISFRDIVRACDGKDGRISCPIEGCEKSYTRKDSLTGHMAVSSGGSILKIMYTYWNRKATVIRFFATMGTKPIRSLPSRKKR